MGLVSSVLCSVVERRGLVRACPVSAVSVRIRAAVRFSPMEAVILAANDGRPIDRSDLLPIRDARRSYAAVRGVIGSAPTVGQWSSTGAENVKLGKSGVYTVGTTYSPGDEPARVLTALLTGFRPIVTGRQLTPDLAMLAAIAELSGIDALVAWARHLTVCPRSTRGCRGECVIVTAGKGPTSSATIGRFARWATLAVDPRAAVTLMCHANDAAIAQGDHRVRFGVADDVRWELVAPVLFDRQPRAYAYSKWAPDARPSTDALPITYSATREGNRWTPATIAETVGRGDNVAVVFRVTRGHPLPATWHGCDVIDGDVSDDRWSDPRGVIVGLRAKGAAVSARSLFTYAV